MNFDIICIGKLKERYWTEAAAEYAKRLGRFCKLNVWELPESRLPDNASPAQEEAVKEAEGKSILAKIEALGRQQAYVFALDPRGKPLSSEGFAERLSQIGLNGKSRAIFVIGGSLGLSDAVRKEADNLLSFSAMTFPHQLFRVMLLEQIYRACKINAGEKYHK
ncbi:MAG: 23S rRNA (pseudouridine(1915)-N(3))-methyltransferase RlmH [Firmicutes bacterium]|nr:23S rRNA (pseudouridine(1915)-N(3))-methyltransferase RlmH [Bacillota bacterium]